MGCFGFGLKQLLRVACCRFGLDVKGSDPEEHTRNVSRLLAVNRSEEMPVPVPVSRLLAVNWPEEMPVPAPASQRPQWYVRHLFPTTAAVLPTLVGFRVSALVGYSRMLGGGRVTRPSV